MDEKFLEFFGNSLINMARAKKQGDDVALWMREWFSPYSGMTSEKLSSGVDDISALFRKAYGLDRQKNSTFDQKKMIEEALSNFQEAFKTHLDSLGFVSKEQHLELVKKYETLKSECNDQKETIENLKMLLKERGHEEKFDLNNIARNQQDLFQEMMKNFGNFLSDTTRESDNDPV